MLQKLNSTDTLVRFASFVLVYAISLTGVYSGKGSFVLELSLAIASFMLIEGVLLSFIGRKINISCFNKYIGIDFFLALIAFEFWINPFVKGFPLEFCVFTTLWGVIAFVKGVIIKDDRI